MYNRSNRCQTSCNTKNNALGSSTGRSMYNHTMMNPTSGACNTMRHECGHKKEMEYDCKKEMDYGCKKEMDCGCKREMDHGCMKEMDRGCMKEMDHGCKKEMECGCMKEMDHGCRREMDYGCMKEMDHGCKKEMECGCKKEMDHGCKKEMECGCKKEMECGCMKELSCDKEVQCDCEMNRGCNMNMNYGCEESSCCSPRMSHEEFYCLLHQLLQYEEGADAEFCKAKKDLQEVLGHLQYGIGCNTKIAELYCMINEWLDCYEEQNSCECNCNDSCRNMRCELHEMVETIHNMQKESCSHAYAACQCLMEAKKLTDCMLEFREKVMRNCYPRQCK